MALGSKLEEASTMNNGQILLKLALLSRINTKILLTKENLAFLFSWEFIKAFEWIYIVLQAIFGVFFFWKYSH